MTFTDHEFDLVRYAIRDVIARRRLFGHQLPAGMEDLDKRLQRERLVSDLGNETHTKIGQLEQEDVEDVIDTIEAASILSITPRRVRQLAADLEGRRCSWGYIFNRQVVIDYANSKGAGVERY